MKASLFAVVLLAAVAVAAPARADGSIAFCKSGPVVAACPDGVSANVSVGIPGNLQGNASVGFAQSNGNSVSGAAQTGNTSIAGSNAGQSIANNSFSNQSVTGTSSSAISVTGSSGSSAASVTGGVH
jgi:hypothetical protein